MQILVSIEEPCDSSYECLIFYYVSPPSPLPFHFHLCSSWDAVLWGPAQFSRRDSYLELRLHYQCFTHRLSGKTRRPFWVALDCIENWPFHINLHFKERYSSKIKKNIKQIWLRKKYDLELFEIKIIWNLNDLKLMKSKWVEIYFKPKWYGIDFKSKWFGIYFELLICPWSIYEHEGILTQPNRIQPN